MFDIGEGVALKQLRNSEVFNNGFITVEEIAKMHWLVFTVGAKKEMGPTEAAKILPESRFQRFHYSTSDIASNVCSR